jgi:hypothetical protein
MGMVDEEVRRRPRLIHEKKYVGRTPETAPLDDVIE